MTMTTMTKEEILAMKAGSNLDALIAEWKDGCYHDWKRESVTHGGLVLRCTKCGAFRESGRQLPNQDYSTDILAAWQVVEKLSDGISDLFVTICRSPNGNCDVSIAQRASRLADSFAPTVPEAICKAALLAKLGVK